MTVVKVYNFCKCFSGTFESLHALFILYNHFHSVSLMVPIMLELTVSLKFKAKKARKAWTLHQKAFTGRLFLHAPSTNIYKRPLYRIYMHTTQISDLLHWA